MNIKTQSEVFIDNLKSRRRNPIKPRTLAAYSSYLRSWIVPLLGDETLDTLENGKMRKFVAKLSEEGLSASTIVSIVNCLKGVVSSALDENGNEIYARKWNNDFIDLPIVNQRDQKAPIIGRPELESAISRAQGIYKPLYITLAGTGARISEGLGIQAGPDDGKGSFWVPDQSKIVIRGQWQDGQFLTPKTDSGFREIDIPNALNQVLQELSPEVGKRIFDIDLLSSYRVLKQNQIPGYHSLRRRRITHLRETGVPEDLIRFWAGHQDRSITDRYSKMATNVSLRREWAERAGLGFTA